MHVVSILENRFVKQISREFRFDTHGAHFFRFINGGSRRKGSHDLVVDRKKPFCHSFIDRRQILILNALPCQRKGGP